MNVLTHRFVRTVPSAVRPGEAWEAEVAVGYETPSLAELVLVQEATEREQSALVRPAARGAWSSWMHNNSLSRMLRRSNDRRRLALQRQQMGERIHRIQITLADSSPKDAFLLAGETSCTTSEKGLAVISGLALWPREDISLDQSSWVKLRALCTTCGVESNRLPPMAESSKIYIAAGASVGIYDSPVAAMSAIARSQPATPTRAKGVNSGFALVLPGRPAQLCVQLLERPFVDVLVKSQQGWGLLSLGPPSIRISPYTWPEPACWHFAAAPQLLQRKIPATYQKVTFQLHSADPAYSNKTGLTWNGMAASDGSAAVVLLASRALTGRARLLHPVLSSASIKVEIPENHHFEAPTWIRVRPSVLQGKIRLPLLVPGAPASPPTAAAQWTEVTNTLAWRDAALAVDLTSSRTDIVLEIRTIGQISTTVHIAGDCVDTDAGGVLLATVNEMLPITNQVVPSVSQTDAHANDKSPWQQLSVQLDWVKLPPEGAGLLQHHVRCTFRASAGNQMQPLQFVPKASVDIIASESDGAWIRLLHQSNEKTKLWLLPA